MLEQIIYTRCSPHRDLKNRGMVLKEDGFGVFSMSKELCHENAMNLTLLQQRLPLKNAANETAPIGLIHSYEYISIQPQQYAFSYEYSRPHCKSPRRNGQAHRSGTFIKQCFIGEFQGYPYEWFGKDCWSAYLKGENDYYLRTDDVPELLPALSPQIPKGKTGISKRDIQTFIKGGRGDILKNMLWFLIDQYSLSVEQRKVLLIKDTPDNVALWVAAITHSFPPDLASHITFSTNMTKLGTQIEQSLFYYTDNTGRIFQGSGNNTNLTRRPFAMIVGYHPEDKFCSSVKALTHSNFATIDGETGVCSFTPDPSILHPFYTALMEGERADFPFFSQILPEFPITELSQQLISLYDACDYLFLQQWRYDEMLKALQTILKIGLPKEIEMQKHLYEQCLNYYPSMSQADSSRGGAFLSCIWKLAQSLNQEKQLFELIVKDCLSFILHNEEEKLQNFWNILQKTALSTLLKPYLKELFHHHTLLEAFSQSRDISPSTSGLVLEMFFTLFQLEGEQWNKLLKDEIHYAFLCFALIQTIPDRKILKDHLQVLTKGGQALLVSVALSVADFLSKNNPDVTISWWEVILDATGGDLPALCEQLCQSSHVSIQLVEQLLSNAVMQREKCPPLFVQSFLKTTEQLKCNSSTGLEFFSAWISVAEPKEFGDIIKEIDGFALYESVESKLFDKMDSVCPYDISQKGINYDAIKKWGESLHQFSATVELWEFLKALRLCRGKEQDLLTAIDKFNHCHITVTPDFLESKYFVELCKVMANFTTSNPHFYLFYSIPFPDQQHKKEFISQYIQRICSFYKSKPLAEKLLMFTECSHLEHTEADYPKEQVEAVQADIQDELCLIVQSLATEPMLEMARKSNYSKETIDTFSTWLKETTEKTVSQERELAPQQPIVTQRKSATDKNSGGFLGGIFGKK